MSVSCPINEKHLKTEHAGKRDIITKYLQPDVLSTFVFFLIEDNHTDNNLQAPGAGDLVYHNVIMQRLPDMILLLIMGFDIKSI